MNNPVKMIKAGRPGIPNPIDIHIGARIRLQRTVLGMSQEQLGDALGLTFQQVQKYEQGTNRVGGSRIYDLSVILGVPVQFFFDDMPEAVEAQSPMKRAQVPVQNLVALELVHDPASKRISMELVRHFHSIKDEKVKKQVYHMVKAMASME